MRGRRIGSEWRRFEPVAGVALAYILLALACLTATGCPNLLPSSLLQEVRRRVDDAGTQADTASPTVGSEIVVGTISQTTVALTWGAASDDRTSQDLIQYRVIRASDPAFLSSTQVAFQQATVVTWTPNLLSSTAQQLEPDTVYYFAVLAQDAAGNMSLYSAKPAHTLDLNAPTPGTGPDFSNIATDSVRVSWKSASDSATKAAQLQYKLVRASQAAAIDTIEEADAITGSGLVFDWTEERLSADVGGLVLTKADASFAVLVRDEDNNRSLYSPNTVHAYTVSFNSAGGTAPKPSSILVPYSTPNPSKYGPLATTTQVGFDFHGWWTTTGTEVTATSPVTIVGDHILTAHWLSAIWAGSVSTGTGNSLFESITLDRAGDVYAAGSQYGTSTYTYGSKTSSGGSMYDNVALVKYNSSGEAQWAKTVSTPAMGHSVFKGVAVDGSGYLYAVGTQYGEGLYTYDAGVTSMVDYPYPNASIIKYDAASGAAQWAYTVDGSPTPYMSSFNAVATDAYDNVYAAGSQYGTYQYWYALGLSATGASQLNNVVLVQYSPGGVAYWAKTLNGGTGDAEFYSVAVGSDGFVYAAGDQTGTGNYTYGTHTVKGTSNGRNAVLVKYNASSGAAVWAKTISKGSGDCVFNGVAADGNGGIYLVGYQTGTGEYQYASGASATGTSLLSNAVIVKFDSSGNALWAQSVFGPSVESGFDSVAATSSGAIYAAGYQTGTGSYSYGSPAVVAGTSTGENVVLVRYDASGNPQWARSAIAGAASLFSSVAVDAAGNPHAAGRQEGTAAHSYGPGVSVSSTAAGHNVVIVKYVP